jgi:hypothetical protein
MDVLNSNLSDPCSSLWVEASYNMANSGEARAKLKRVHLGHGCINLCYCGCIYGENLEKTTIFKKFGGAFAPPSYYLPSPLMANDYSMSDEHKSIIQLRATLS